MTPVRLLLTTLALLLPAVQGLVIIDSTLATQCIYYLKGYDWGCNSTKQNSVAYSCRCHNSEWIGSVTSCLESQGALQDRSRAYIDHAYAHVRKRCLSKGRIDWPVDVLKAYQRNASLYLQDPTASDVEVELTHPISVNVTEFEYYKQSFQHVYHQVMISQGTQWGYVFFWVAVLVCGTIFNFGRHFAVSYWGNKRTTPQWLGTFRSNCTLPNLFSKSYHRVFGFWPVHLPKTYESIVLFLFVAYSILASSLGFSISLPNAYMNGYTWQILDLIGYRSALASFGLIPVTFFFGIRNNPFIRLTGSSLTTFLHYHKWSAWMMAIQAMIHSAVWTNYTIREGDYSVWAVDAYWQWGVAGTTILFLMLFLAVSIFREIAYELFLLIHQLFGIFFIVSMWKHCDTLGWMGWIYAVIAIWGYDRIVRFVSVLINGGVTTAKITKLNEELFRVVVHKPVSATYFPGCYNYYYFLNLHLRFFQSHPFSLMKSKRSGEEDLYAIVVKVHKGITKKIQQQVCKTEKGSSMLVDVLTEGPYGSPVPLRAHEQFVFISAGVGFTPCYSQAVELVEKNIALGKSVMIRFIWVMADYEYLQLFMPDLDYLIQHGADVDIILTRETRLHEIKGLTITALGSRPDAAQLVKAVTIHSSTCFVSSGPAAFIDHVRAGVVDVTATSTIRVDLYEESFTM